MGFIDWVTMRVPFDHNGQAPIQDGYIERVRESGTVEYRTIYGKQVEGSHGTGVQVRSGSDYLDISGNPTKWLQGHNLFGSGDGKLLLSKFMVALMPALKLEYQPADLASWRQGAARLTRIDVTHMYKLPSGMVGPWLATAGAVIHAGHQKVHDIGLQGAETVYVGQRSKRISLKIYDKAREITKPGHGFSIRYASDIREKLLEYASDTLRVEVTARGQQLREDSWQLDNLGSWHSVMCDAVIWSRLEALTMLDNTALSESDVSNLPPRLLPVYDAWRAGRDLRTVYKSKDTFYKYRRELLAFDIDIAVVRPRAVAPVEREYRLGAPLRSFLECPMESPEWARGTELLVG